RPPAPLRFGGARCFARLAAHQGHPPFGGPTSKRATTFFHGSTPIMNRAYAFVSPSQLPRPDGSTARDALGIPGVTSLPSRVGPVLIGAQIVEAEVIEATFEPTAEDLAWLAGRSYRFCGWARHRLHLPPRKGLPVVFFVYGPCYEIAEDDGDLWYRWAPLP